MKRLTMITGLFFSFLLPSQAVAQLEFDAEKPRIFSIQPRLYRLGHEFQLGVGVLPLDAFYVGAVSAASYTYHFSDFWAWEIAGAGYSYNFDTGLREQLSRDYEVEPVKGGGKRISLMATTSLVVKPLFGKLAVFNLDTIHSETFFVAGIGSLRKGEDWLPTIDLGVGFRFWTGAAVSLRFDIRDYLVFGSWLPENALFFMVSAALNYYNPDEREKKEWVQ